MFIAYNDGLRGSPINQISANLNSMIDLIEASGAKAIMVGISLPPSYGARYIDKFRKVFTDISEQRKLPFIDFYQESFFTSPGYIQEDGLHPTEITQPLIRDKLLEFLQNNSLLE